MARAASVRTDAPEPQRIALLSGPMLPIPPPGYAGTERVVAALADALVERGHEVTLFAPGDSKARGVELVPTVPGSLWTAGLSGDMTPFLQISVERIWAEHERFDVIHSHIEAAAFSFARHARVPVVSTLHGRLDAAGMPELLDEFREIPLVAISESQRRWKPENNWVATIHHGLPTSNAFSDTPGDYLVFVGRAAREKGIDDAIELARDTGMRLRMAAKIHEPEEREVFAQLIEPAIADGAVEFEGELPPAQRDPLLMGALATVMLGAWPEPFGLVAIESMATGTPVIARRAGALPEIIEHGRTGFLVDDLGEAKLAVEMAADIDRRAVREAVLRNFSVDRMVDEYLDVYRSLAGEPAAVAG